MKLGLIIIFNNNRKDVNRKELIEQFRLANDIEICMVDNESKDGTLEDLKEIRESCSNVSVVEIKKQITQEASKRAGARYMFNKYNLKHLGYMDVNMLRANHFKIDEVLKLIYSNIEALIEYDKELKQKAVIKPTLFKTVFAVMDYIKTVYNNKMSSNINLIIV